MAVITNKIKKLKLTVSPAIFGVALLNGAP